MTRRSSAAITHVAYGTACDDVTTPDGSDIVIQRHAGKITVLQTGLITRPVALDYLGGDEYLSISFTPGVFMPRLPGARIGRHGRIRPLSSERAFALDNEELEIPTFENADSLVDRLVRRDLIVRDEIVAERGGGPPRAISPRSVQRHFLQTLGLTPKQLAQIQRARRAVELLRAGGRPVRRRAGPRLRRPAAHDPVAQGGHGQTPGEIACAASAALIRPRRDDCRICSSPAGRSAIESRHENHTVPHRRASKPILDDLRERLARTRWPEQPDGGGLEHGHRPRVHEAPRRPLAEPYDWRAQEAALNAHPQFIADVDGIDLHFVHVRGKGPNPTPLLLIHSFPDSFYRFHKVISPADRSGRARRRPGPVVRRRDPVAARLRLLGAHAACRSTQTADTLAALMAGPGLRALPRGRRRRTGPDRDVAAPRRRGHGDLRRRRRLPGRQHRLLDAVAARDGVRPVDPGLVDARGRVQHDPVDQAAEPGVCPQRLAGRAGGLADDPAQQRRRASRWSSGSRSTSCSPTP